jgi:hypothetical protein
MVLPVDNDFFIDRASLATVFKDPRTLSAMETALQVVQATPEAVTEVQAAADAAQSTASDAASAADTAQDAADAAQATADSAAATAAAASTTASAASAAASAAQGGVLALNAAPFVTLATSATLSNERVVTAAGGVSFDTATAGQLKIIVDALAILNALASIVFTKPVDVQGALQCDSLRIDAAPAASVTAASHALAINLSGTTYYLKLSATP